MYASLNMVNKGEVSVFLAEINVILINLLTQSHTYLVYRLYKFCKWLRDL